MVRPGYALLKWLVISFCPSKVRLRYPLPGLFIPESGGALKPLRHAVKTHIMYSNGGHFFRTPIVCVAFRPFSSIPTQLNFWAEGIDSTILRVLSALTGFPTPAVGTPRWFSVPPSAPFELSDNRRVYGRLVES